MPSYTTVEKLVFISDNILLYQSLFYIKMITICFKRELFLFIVFQVETILSETVFSKCSRCLEGHPFDNKHSCYRIRTGEVQYELFHIHMFFTESLIKAIRRLNITSHLNDLKYNIAIELLRHGHTHE